MSVILNIETSGRVCSVCLGVNGQSYILKESSPTNSHSELISSYISQVLSESKYTIETIDAVAVSAGPGSYTGLRIGISAAKGICYGNQIPLIALSSLEIMAYKMKTKLNLAGFYYAPLMESMRDEIYFSVYDYRLNTIQNPKPALIDGELFNYLTSIDNLCVGGSGLNKLSSFKTYPFSRLQSIDIEHSSASDMVYLSHLAFEKQDFQSLIYFEPFYLKGVYINNQYNG